MQKDLTVYVLVRNDLPSLNPGKAAAQVHHAGVQMMVKHANHALVKSYISDGVAGKADGFNTTLTLSASLPQIEACIGKVKNLEALCDIVVDPTYPFFVDREIAPFLELNQQVTRIGGNGPMELFLRNELTCAWALGDRNDVIFKSVFENLQLL
jgi:peptidyl-tRNA hydrolase